MNQKLCLAMRPARPLTTTAVALGMTLAITAPAMADQAVVITGVQFDDASWTNTSDLDFTVQDFCNNANIIENELSKALAAVDQAMTESGWAVPVAAIENIPDMPNRSEIAAEAANAKSAVCNAEEEQSRVEVFTITYARCRMSMTTPTYAMVISMPDNTEIATMLAADHNTREVVHFEMKSWLDEAGNYTGPGWSDQVTINSTGETTEIFGFDTEHYNFRYESGLGETDMGELGQIDVEAGQVNNEQRLGNLVKVTSTGNAWISSTAPGIDIVKSFYETLTSRFRPESGTHSFMSGLVNAMVGILDKGIPIVMEHENTSSIAGRTMGGGKSESHVSNIRLRDLPPDYCAADPTPPPGYTVTDVNEAMSNADMPSSAEMAAAMQEYEEAMAGLTPEQQQMVQQYGMGDMMQQVTGGGDNPAAAQAATGSGAAAARSGSNMPPSEELTGATVTESVQRHLAALGYEVGDPDGELSLSTQIAISTFQAEKGLEVTGEVTPQLLGLLSAEVDKRR